MFVSVCHFNDNCVVMFVSVCHCVVNVNFHNLCESANENLRGLCQLSLEIYAKARMRTCAVCESAVLGAA